MTTTLADKLHIDSWDEKASAEADDGTKFTTAAVTLSFDQEVGGDAVTAARFDAAMYYRPDGTSTYVSIMQVTATLAGRSGGFALSGEGGYEDGTARMHMTVIEGSGSGGLEGVTGTLESASTHDDYPYMPFTLHYDLR